MENADSLFGLGGDIDCLIRSLSLEQSITSAELVLALQTGESPPELMPSVARFLDAAPLQFILRILLAPGTGEHVSGLITPVVMLAVNAHCDRASTLDVELRCAMIPDDFPMTPENASDERARVKKTSVAYGGRAYPIGTSPPEVLESWTACEVLAQQVVKKILPEKPKKYAYLSPEEVLLLYENRLLRTGWGTNAQMRWVIRRATQLMAGLLAS